MKKIRYNRNDRDDRNNSRFEKTVTLDGMMTFGETDDGLNALDDLIGVKALGLADLAALLHGADAVLSEDAIDLVDSSFVAFKQCHNFALLLIPVWGRHTWRRCRTGRSDPWPFPERCLRRRPS